jgi:hypothetical protein
MLRSTIHWLSPVPSCCIDPARQLGFAASTLPVDAAAADSVATGGGRHAPSSKAGTARLMAGRSGSSNSRGGSWQLIAEQDAEAVEPHWGLGVYQRVFLTEAAAQAWYGWNSMRGDPAQPFHYHQLLQRLQQEVGRVGRCCAACRKVVCVPCASSCSCYVVNVGDVLHQAVHHESRGVCGVRVAQFLQLLIHCSISPSIWGF